MGGEEWVSGGIGAGDVLAKVLLHAVCEGLRRVMLSGGSVKSGGHSVIVLFHGVCGSQCEDGETGRNSHTVRDTIQG